MRYRVRLINRITHESQLTLLGFTSKKKAIEWATLWKRLTPETDCEIIDTKNNFAKVAF